MESSDDEEVPTLVEAPIDAAVLPVALDSPAAQAVKAANTPSAADVSLDDAAPVPVTILTGYLGSVPLHCLERSVPC
jgi:hypothetical protein